MPLLRRLATGACAITTVLALGACTENDNGNNTLANASSSAPGAPATTAPPLAGSMEAKDNEFVPKTASAKAGTITFDLENTGTAPHTFTSTDLGVDVNADAGKTAKVEIKDAKPGTYKFVCKYHESAGMVGELTVV